MANSAVKIDRETTVKMIKIGRAISNDQTLSKMYSAITKLKSELKVTPTSEAQNPRRPNSIRT